MSDTNLQSEPEYLVDTSTSGDYRVTDFEQKAIKCLRLLWGRRELLFRAVTASLFFGLCIAFLLHVRYESTAQLMPPDNQSGSTAMLASLIVKAGSGIGGMAGDLLGLKNSGDLFVGILRSRTVQDRLVHRFDLKELYGVRLHEDARKELADRTGIAVDRKSGIISVTVSDRSPQRAAALAGAYIEELDKLVAEVSVSSARRERMFLEDRLKAVKSDLDQASNDFSQFESKNTTIDLKEQGRAMVEAAARLQGELIAAESELHGLKEIYAANNVRVRALEARVRELRDQLNKLGGARDASTEPSQPSLYPSIRQLPILGVTYADLYRRTKIQEIVYESLTQQYELAKVQEAKETPTVKILDEPAVPERKSFPPRVLIVLLCGTLGLGGSVLWVLGETKWHELNSERPSKLLLTQVFSNIEAKMPWAPPNGSRFQAMTHNMWKRLSQRF